MGQPKYHYVQQREKQNPSPGEEEPHVPAQAWDLPAGRKLCRKDPQGPGGQQVNPKPGMHPHGKEGQQSTSLHYEYCQQVEGGDHSCLLRTKETECWLQFWAPNYKRVMDILQ